MILSYLLCSFDYEDSSATKDDDDVLYYNADNEPIPVESVFDRRERLDVKKPGPFFTNSPNNFFLDKVNLIYIETLCQDTILFHIIHLIKTCSVTPRGL